MVNGFLLKAAPHALKDGFIVKYTDPPHRELNTCITVGYSRKLPSLCFQSLYGVGHEVYRDVQLQCDATRGLAGHVLRDCQAFLLE